MTPVHAGVGENIRSAVECDRRLKAEGWRVKAEDGGQRTGDGGQRTEDGRVKGSRGRCDEGK